MALHGEWRLRDDSPETGPGLQASALVRNVPAPSRGVRVARQGRESQGNDAENFSGEALDVLAFPSVVEESIAFRRRRLVAYRDTWRSIKAHAEEVLGKSHAEMFEAVREYVADEHAKAARVLEADQQGRSWSCALAVDELPVGFIFAGGVNSSDHHQTFQDLEAFLRDQGNYVARLQPSEGQKDSGPGLALSSALQQFSGLEGNCGEDADALSTWYRDAVAHAAAEHPGVPGEGGHASRARPAALILQELEAWDPACLCDLLLLLSEARARFPVVVLAHVSTSATALQRVLQSDAATRIRASTFRLPSALTRLELILRDVLLSGQHAVLLSPSVFMAIDEIFNHHDFTSASLMRGLQVAILTHFMSEPLAHLMPAAQKGEEEIRQAVDEMVSKSPQLVAYGRKQLCPEIDRSAPDEAIADGIVAALIVARKAQVGQAMALRWLSSAAAVLAEEDPSSFRSGFGVKDLFRVGCFPSYFAPGGSGMTSLAQIAAAISGMKAEQARPLLEGFLRDVGQVQGAAAVGADLVKTAVDILESASAPERKPASKSGGSEASSVEAASDEGKRESSKLEQEGPSSAKRAAAASSASSGKSPSGSSGSRRLSYGASRRGALSAALADVSSRAASASPASSKKVDHEREPGRRAAALLKSAVERFLTKHPSSHSGSAVLLCRGTLPEGQNGSVRLTGAPRLAVHRAMYPADYLPAVLDDGISTAAMKHDTATAYQLAQNQGEFINLADWFTQFAEVVAEREEAAEGKEGSAGSPESEGQASRGKKRKRQTKNRTPAAKEAKRRAPPSVSEVLADKDQRLALAARFTQATSELQLLGYIKPSRRNRQEAAQRLVFPYTAE